MTFFTFFHSYFPIRFSPLPIQSSYIIITRSSIVQFSPYKPYLQRWLTNLTVYVSYAFLCESPCCSMKKHQDAVWPFGVLCQHVVYERPLTGFRIIGNDEWSEKKRKEFLNNVFATTFCFVQINIFKFILYTVFVNGKCQCWYFGIDKHVRRKSTGHFLLIDLIYFNFITRKLNCGPYFS